MYPPTLSYDEIATRRRKYIRNATLGLIGITVLSLTAWIYFKELEPGTPLMNNVVVFALVNLNIILLMVLVLLVLRNLVRLYYSIRSGAGGARLQVKLIVAFVGFTLIPTIALFFVASGLIDKSFNFLFDTKVEGALKGSFEVAQTYYRESERNALADAQALAAQIVSRGWGELTRNETLLREFLEEKRMGLRADSIELFFANSQEVASARKKDLSSKFRFSPRADFLGKVLDGEVRAAVESFGENDVVRGIAPIKAGEKVTGFLVVSRIVPERLVEWVKGIFATYEDFKELELSKNPIKGSFIITFLLVALLILFAAIWFGFYIARGITIPIEKLAEGTRAVSEGELEHQVDVLADGEVGILVDAFNNMTRELLANKKKIEAASEDLRRSSSEIDRRRRYMEAMLENIGTGVVSINRRGQITVLNKAAGELLQFDPHWAFGRYFHEVFQSEHLRPIRQLLRIMREEERASVSDQVEIVIGGRVLTLRASLTLLRSADGNRLGAVVVFDDMTALIRAQKVAAWSEVAQGIAHEIKNPLTPIQLSAQRMRRKYQQKADDFAEVFEHCTDTIIHQVQGLMEMVNEFNRFARMPEARLRSCQINGVIDEVITLYRDRRPDIQLRMEVVDGLPLIWADAEQLQRLFINLLKNAMEAMKESGEIMVWAEVDNKQNQLSVEVADQGEGIPEESKWSVFYPYFSTKSRGSGLGLAICHRIVSDHNGSITVRDNQPRGSVFRVTFPLAHPSTYVTEMERSAAIG